MYYYSFEKTKCGLCKKDVTPFFWRKEQGPTDQVDLVFGKPVKLESDPVEVVCPHCKQVFFARLEGPPVPRPPISRLPRNSRMLAKSGA